MTLFTRHHALARRASRFAALGLLLFGPAVFATPVKWTLNNVVSLQGVSVTGSFVYDLDTNSYSNIDLTASNGKRFTASLRPPSDFANNNTFIFAPHESPVVSGTSQTFFITTPSGKGNSGGTVNLNTAQQSGGFFICTNDTCTTNANTNDSQVVSGSLTGVPLYPYVSSLSPTFGNPSGGNTVTLTGITFTGATDVKFGTQSVGAGNFTVVNDTIITAIAPAGTVGTTVKVTVTGPLGTSAAADSPGYAYHLPTASNVRILTGTSAPSSITDASTATADVEVKGIYSFRSAYGQEAKGANDNPRSTYRWALNSSSTGAGTVNANGANATGNTSGAPATSGRPPVITNLNAISYIPVASDTGKFLYYCVTPASTIGQVGTEACSAAGIPVCESNPAPAQAPTKLIVSPGSRQVTVSFLPPSGSMILNYEYSTDGGTTWTAFKPEVTSSPVSITQTSGTTPATLVDNTLYPIMLRAVGCNNKIGQSSAAATVTPGADADTDSVSTSIEDAVPGANGGTGDGNGDGIADRDQNSVSSLPGSDGTTFVTVVSTSGKVLSKVVPAATPSDLTPTSGSILSGVAFTINGVTNGGTETVELYLPNNGMTYTSVMKKNRITGVYDALPTTVTTVGSKAKLSFSLVDGGPYDTDGLANGSISDPAFAVGGPTAAASGGGGAMGLPVLLVLGGLALLGVALRRNKRLG